MPCLSNADDEGPCWLEQLNTAASNGDADRVRALLAMTRPTLLLGAPQEALPPGPPSWPPVPASAAPFPDEPRWPSCDPNRSWNRGNDPGPALHVAIAHRHEAVIAALLDDPQVDPNVLDEFGHPPLHRAVCHNGVRDSALATVTLLLDRGASPTLHAVHAWGLPDGTHMTLAEAAVFWSGHHAADLLDLFDQRGLLPPVAERFRLLEIAVQANSPYEDGQEIDLLSVVSQAQGGPASPDDPVGGEVRAAVRWLLDHGTPVLPATPTIPTASDGRPGVPPTMGPPVQDPVRHPDRLLDLAHRLRETSPITFARLERAVLVAQMQALPIPVDLAPPARVARRL